MSVTRSPSWPPPPPHPLTAPAANQPPPPRLDGPPPSAAPNSRWPLRGRRWASRLAALILIAVGLGVDSGGLFIVGAVFVLVVPFEKLFPRHRQRIRRPHVGTDIAYALAGGLLNIVGLIAAVPVAVLSLAWVPGLLLRPLVSSIPPVITPVLGLLLFDVAIYWTHRWYHEVPLLWRFHAIHHSTNRLDWISGFRAHPLDGTLIAPAVIFLLAAGFSPEVTGVLAVVQIVIGIFLHANVRWRLRPLHRFVITPEFHHWHHANEPGAINSNYSVFLPAWDLVFGTYFMPADRRPQRYGVDEFIPEGMIGQLRHPLRDLPPWRRLLWSAIRHPWRSVRSLARLGRCHIFAPIRRSGLRRSRTASPTPTPVELFRVVDPVAGSTTGKS